MSLCVSLKIRCEHMRLSECVEALFGRQRSETACRSLGTVLSPCVGCTHVSIRGGSLSSRLPAQAFWAELADMCSP